MVRIVPYNIQAIQYSDPPAFIGFTVPLILIIGIKYGNNPGL